MTCEDRVKMITSHFCLSQELPWECCHLLDLRLTQAGTWGNMVSVQNLASKSVKVLSPYSHVLPLLLYAMSFVARVEDRKGMRRQHESDKRTRFEDVWKKFTASSVFGLGIHLLSQTQPGI